jgi:hypothetical protein
MADPVKITDKELVKLPRREAIPILKAAHNMTDSQAAQLLDRKKGKEVDDVIDEKPKGKRGQK